MNLEDYWRVLRRNWLVIVACAVLGLGVSLGITVMMPKVYQADASGFVLAQGNGLATNATLGDSYAKSRANPTSRSRRTAPSPKR